MEEKTVEPVVKEYEQKIADREKEFISEKVKMNNDFE